MAQEICDNGIDDDGDGLIDVNDPDCASFYGLTFVGDATDCSVPPPANSNFFDVVDAPAVSGQNTVDTQSKMAIGDVDGDGIPDVVATSKWNQQIRVIATTDGQADGSDAGDLKASWKTTDPSAGNVLIGGGSTFYFDLETMIADIDRDGTAELFATIYQRNNSTQVIEKFFIGRWDYDGTTGLVNTWAIDLGSNGPGIPGIADFDGDGNAEIYFKNMIISAETGATLADSGGDWNSEVNGAPAAVNIIGDNRLELVSGRYIYTVTGSPVSGMSVAQDMNALGLAQYYPKEYNDVFEYGITNFSSTSVADFDNDGNIDVFLSGAEGSITGATTVFYWNVAKGTVGTFAPSHPDVDGVSYPNGFPWGTGRVNLGELDGDGILEANFISGNQLWALEEGGGGTLVQLWAGPRTINDSRSGVLTTTVYDFDNDGNPELIYRDSQTLNVIDGATGTTTHWSTTCQSHTMTEGPIIADVNGDGATDICVPCFTGPGIFKIDGDLPQQALGEISLFFSSENAWLPTRKVYNQSGYFAVNINDDLTLPFGQLNQAMQFGDGSTTCSNGSSGPQQPFNSFLNQVPSVSASGCPTYPGPDPIITIVENSSQTQCLPLNGELEVFITGGNAGFTFAWFDNLLNPLGVTSAIATGLSAGEYTVTVTKSGCTKTQSYTLSGPVFQDGVAITTANVTDCANPNSGAIDADASIGGVIQDPSNYDFIWYHYDDATNNIGSQISTIYGTGKSRTGLPIGWYAVVVKNKTTNCESFPPVPTLVADQTVTPTVTLTELEPNSSCDSANPNGRILVNIFSGGVADLPVNYNIEWFEGDNTLPANLVSTMTGTNGEIVTNIGSPGITYTVKVTSTLNCSVIDKLIISQNVITPVITATAVNNSICDSALSSIIGFSGAVHSVVTFNGVVVSSADLAANYTFVWYDGSDITIDPIITDSTRVSLAHLDAGFYSVTVSLDSVGCTSLPISVEVASDSASPNWGVIIAEEFYKDSGQPSLTSYASAGALVRWYDDAIKTTLLFTGTPFIPSTSQLDMTVAGNTQFFATQDEGCGESVTTEIKVTIEPNVETDILSFSILEQTDLATFDNVNHTISIEVANGTDVTSLTPTITGSSGATILPNSGEAQDFTNPVNYLVTAEDGITTENWMVTVNVSTLIKEDQTITFDIPSVLYLDQAPYPLVATASSGLEVEFILLQGDGTIWDGNLMFTQTSNMSIKATQAGNDLFNEVEIIRDVEIKGTYEITIGIIRPDGSPLTRGLAKLFHKEGGLYEKQEFTNGSVTFEDVREGEYILQVIPLGSETSDIFPTYYTTSHFHNEADMLVVGGDVSISMTMLGKKELPDSEKGSGKISGKVLNGGSNSGGRVEFGRILEGEGLTEIPVYLIDESTREIYSSTVTDLTGLFQFEDLASNSYKLVLDVVGVDQEWSSFSFNFNESLDLLEVSIVTSDNGPFSIDYNSILGLDPDENSVSVYPNPTRGNLYLNGLIKSNQKVYVININGVIVKEFNLSGTQNQLINIRELTPGVYFLKIGDNGDQLMRIIKK